MQSTLEAYAVVAAYLKQNENESGDAKDRLKKIQNMANRMHKEGEIELREAISKINFKNAVNFFTGPGTRRSDDAPRLADYAAAIKNYLTHLQP